MKTHTLLFLIFSFLYGFSQVDSVVTIKDSVKVMSTASKYTDVLKLSRDFEKAVVIGYYKGFYKLKMENNTIGWVEGFSIKEHSYDLTQYGSHYSSSKNNNSTNSSPNKKLKPHSSGCPTTASCGCSNKKKADCHGPCCSWVVGKGCGCK